MKSKIFALGVLALLTASACTSHHNLPPEPKAASRTISGFDVPKIDGITIDGNAADWIARGFHIDLFNSLSRHRPAPENLDVRARLSWSDHGLAVLVQVMDDVSDESRDDTNLAWGDSVELTLISGPKGAEKLQVFIAPGGTKDHPSCRVDCKPPAAQLPAGPKCEAVALRGKDGYTIEALIPWNLLKLTPHLGDELGVQIAVNDADDKSANERMIWYSGRAEQPYQTPVATIRLKEVASPPETAAFIVQTDALPRLAIQAVTRNPNADDLRVFKEYPGNQIDALTNGGGEIGKAKFEFRSGLGTATLPLTLPPLGAKPQTITVEADRKFASYTFADLNRQRIGMVQDMELKFSPFVFSGTKFPRVELENPERAEMLIGEYQIATRFFDAEMNEVKHPNKPGRYGAFVELTAAGMKPFQQFITLYHLGSPVSKKALPWQSDGRLSLPVEMGVDPQMQVTAEYSEFIKDRFLAGFREDRYTAAMLAALSEAKPAESMPGHLPMVEEHEMHYWYDLRKKIGLPETYPSIAWLPNNGAATTEKRPLIMFLHGSGERGEDFTSLEFDGPRGYAKRHPDFPFIVISPLCPNGEWWNALRVLDQVDEAVKKYDADPDRIYITGLSMGGFGTWGALQIDPKRFAAAAVVCGGGTPAKLDAMADLPIWVFHGGKDKNVIPEQSFRFVEGLRKAKGRVKFTFYPELAHSIWGQTYNDPRLYDWLLAQKRGQPAEPRSSTPGTQPTEIK